MNMTPRANHFNQETALLAASDPSPDAMPQITHLDPSGGRSVDESRDAHDRPLQIGLSMAFTVSCLFSYTSLAVNNSNPRINRSRGAGPSRS
jgi:hypothetical protein